jgi:hypothetical protein
MNPEKFIENWINSNPEGCKALAGAVLYSYFNDNCDDSAERILSLQKSPDSEDLNNELVEAIRSTNVLHCIEDILGPEEPSYW